MNKKDIAHIRRQFKPDNDLLNIRDIFNVYIMKESSEIYHHESRPFGMLDREQQELFLGNFKKLLGGQLDEKLFAIKLQRKTDTEETPAQLILHSGLLADPVEDWKEQMLHIVGKLLKEAQYASDMVVTFIRGQYYKPTKRRNEETEENERDEVYAHSFIMCSVNKTEQPDKIFVFDYAEREFKCNVVVDPVINLDAPEAGFLFPSFVEHTADVNYVLYSAGKANQPDPYFIAEVLNGEMGMTSQENKAAFEEIVREVAGDQLDTSTLANVYDEVNRMVSEHEGAEPPTLDYKDVERVLTVSGVENVNADKVEAAFRHVVDDHQAELKAGSVVPKFTSKSIKINTKVANIAISPQDLKYVKQVMYKGKRCILIEVDEETVIEGFTMSTEVL